MTKPIIEESYNSIAVSEITTYDEIIRKHNESYLSKAYEIYRKYDERYNGHTQGLCDVIAQEIISCIPDAIPVRGYIRAATGWKRSHWWVEINGITFDPFGDQYSKTEPGFYREIIGKGDYELLDNIINGVYE